MNQSRPRARKHLLLHNLFNYGHFLVYAANITQWALSRGFHVTLMGRGLAGTGYARRFASSREVDILEMAPGSAMDQREAAWAKPELLARAAEDILVAQRSLAPDATILLNADDFLHEGVGILDPDFAFRSPTVGVVTFGHRDHYLGFKDAYAARLDTLIQERRPFSAICTLDEYHAAAVDPEERYLVFLPDMYSEPSGGLVEAEPEEARRLRSFLDGGTGPVIPILGKFDARKNAVWTLRLVAEHPQACCVVLGERLPCREDLEIDAILTRLTAEGRAFVLTGFVPEGLLRMTLAHARTTFLPLPYVCHYGSSGLQFMALEYGKPSLVPDNGLMARRVADHGLGRVFEAGRFAAYERAFLEFLAPGRIGGTSGIRRFMSFFSERARVAQLDKALGLGSGEDVLGALLADRVPEPAAFQAMHSALDLHLRGEDEAALAQMEAALAESPGNGTLLFRKAMVLSSLGDERACSSVLSSCLASGGGDELDFYVRVRLDAAAELLRQGDGSGVVEAVKSTLGIIPGGIAGDAAVGVEPLLALAGKSGVLSSPTWQKIGALLAQAGAHPPAATAFRQALALDASEHSYRLNLSDVLRYAGLYEESAGVLDELSRLAPGFYGIHHKRGQIFYEMGLLGEAKREFLSEPAQSPHHLAASRYLEKLGGWTVSGSE
ncbi:hypothetical protein [Fundidesulfovibrio terrae]|uniref:hypothetical protein n=1 Tax=Fundidesulfovibrio terrae TaxID=2922866 RepID=UPI001FAE8FCF|nr:hypothetical protein [Fundidesulfovibrio terrae]